MSKLKYLIKNLVTTKKVAVALWFSCLLSSQFLNAQPKKFQGQAPIKIVSTEAKPIQKQWKGIYSFDEPKLYFTNNFEGGRLNGIIRSNDSTYTALITSENTPINPSPWYAFKVWSVKERTIDLVLTYQDGAKHRYYPKLSNDGRNWLAINSLSYTEYDKGEADFGMNSLPVTVRLKLKVSKDTLWVAAQELQTSSHVKKWAQDLSNKRTITHSVFGKSREGRDMQLLTIGKTKNKKMLMVISRQHPPEVTGYLAMKSFVETIASDTKLARRFRRKYTTYVVPLMNPDGVDNGHWRHNTGGVDLNRDWAQFNHPETTAVKELMEERVAKTKGTFYFGIDFHSTWDDIYYTLDEKFKGNMPGLVPDWLDAIKAELGGYDPNIRPSDQLQPTTVSRNHFFVAHGAESLIFEIGDKTPRNFIKEKGRISAEKLMLLLLERN